METVKFCIIKFYNKFCYNYVVWKPFNPVSISVSFFRLNHTM